MYRISIKQNGIETELPLAFPNIPDAIEAAEVVASYHSIRNTGCSVLVKNESGRIISEFSE
jgi:hypothetical protein